MITLEKLQVANYNGRWKTWLLTKFLHHTGIPTNKGWHLTFYVFMFQLCTKSSITHGENRFIILFLMGLINIFFIDKQFWIIPFGDPIYIGVQKKID